MPGTLVRPAPLTAPLGVAYSYRARTYPWAIRRLAAAEAVHGRPPADDRSRAASPRQMKEASNS